ncbi:universal stress protein [Pseudomonas sp.]|uniref:universal stress protein n=1 Tax=Pseudomonas sp. TaxID=306 RepID=UPI0039C9E332
MQRTPAFERAVALARAGGEHLRIVALDYIRALDVMGVFDPSALTVLRQSYLQIHRLWLEDQAAQERTRGLDCSVEVLWTNRRFDAISAFIKTTQPRMLIKDVHHEPLFARIFSTPLDWHLLRDCACPVQFVTDALHPLPGKLLVAVNLYRYEEAELKLNDTLVRTASSLAKQCRASVHVLYSDDWSAFYAANVTLLGALPIETGFHEALSEGHAEAFASLCERHAIPSECRHFLTGTPQPTISAFARENDIDLLIMGTLPRRSLERIIGNTAESLLLHAPCSVLIVKPGEDASQASSLFSVKKSTAMPRTFPTTRDL